MMPLERRVYIGLGSNLGDRAANLKAATAKLGAQPGIDLLRASSVYETAPVGVEDQPDFLNAVVHVSAELSPSIVLTLLKRIERELGRTPGRRWGERLIDLDLLLYGDEVIQQPDLAVPHPEMWRRLFVLIPLAELEPELRSPDGKGISEIIAHLQTSQRLRPAAALLTS